MNVFFRTGSRPTVDQLSALLSNEQVCIVSADGKQVDPGWLKNIRPDALIVWDPAHEILDRSMMPGNAQPVAVPLPQPMPSRSVQPMPAPGIAPKPTETSGNQPGNPEIEQLLQLTNKARSEQGLPKLALNATLTEAAMQHSTNMVRQRTLAHDLDGKGPAERIRALGYRFGSMGENIAEGQRTSAEAIDSWLRSPGHRANLLGSAYTEVGFGVATTTDGRRYWTQLFATPLK